jgi:hypothetical protein
MASDYSEQLKATAHERNFRIQTGRNGKMFLQRQNQFDGTWKMDSREGSTGWMVAMDMVRRGWATLIEDVK